MDEAERLAGIEHQLKKGETRMGAIESGMGDLDDRMTKIATDLKKNNALTEEIRDVVVATKAVGSILKWAGTIGGGLVGLYATAKGLHWWGQ